MAKFDLGNAEQDNGTGNEAGNSNGSGPGAGSDAGTSTDIGNGTGNDQNQAPGSDPASAAAPKKRRGRAAFPRDGDGNIIYPDGYVRKSKESVAVGFVPNDKVKVREQIQGIHAAVAMLAQQPVLLLNDNEAIEFTNNLCAVLDYHHINITSSGGPGMLYVMLLISTYNIYWPRMKAIRSGNGQEVRQDSRPPASQPPPNKPASGMMDFSADIAETVQ